MRGERTLRVGTSGWLLLAVLAVFAVLLASAATQPAPAKSPLERLAAGESVPLQPRTLDVDAREIAHESLTEESTVWDTGERTSNPLGGPGPEPTDAPFGAEVKVHPASPNAETEPSVAGDATGSVLIAAYTEAIGANRNIVISRSTDGGTIWTRIPVASAAYNEFDPRVVWHGGAGATSRFYVFYSHDEGANPRAFRYALSTNGGTSWAINILNYGAGAPFRDLRNPDASLYNGPCTLADFSVSANCLYVVYAINCDVAALCPGGVAMATVTILFNSAGTVVPPSIYFPFGIDIIEPAIQANQDQTLWIADMDGGDPSVCGIPGSHDVVWINTQTGLNTAASWLNAFITGTCSTDFVRVDASGFCPVACPPPTPTTLSIFNFPYQFIGGPFPNHAIVNLWSDDSGASWTLDLIAGVPGIEFKDPAAFASVPLFHVTFWQAGDLYYTYTLDLTAGFAAPIKVNSNSGTVVDGFRFNDVTYAGGVRVVWQDTRDGAPGDVWYSDFSGWAFYIFDKNPRQGTIDIDTFPTAVATAQLWQTGTMHTATCPSPDPGPPGVRYVFQQWSDADTNPAKSITVGSVDVTLVCMYTTQYFLDISTPVGTTTPTSGWYASGAPVTIEWISPAPGACVRYTFGGWTGNGPGSFTGMTNPVGITMNGPIQEIADATREFCFVFDTSPTGLLLSIDAGPNVVAPQTVWWVEGSSGHTVQAITPQSPGSPDQRFVFSNWLDGPTTNPRSVPTTASLNLTAVFGLQYQLRITPTPSDCDFIVDSITYTSAVTLWAPRDSNHNVDVPQPQLITADTRYQFGTWSDGGAKSHTVTLNVPQTLDVTCITEYRHVFDTSPSVLNLVVDAGAPIAAPQTLWWASGSIHTVEFPTPQSVGADSRRVFTQWSDTSTANPRTFSVSGPATLTVQTALEHRVRFATVPANVGITILVNSVPVTAPGEAWLGNGLPATIEASSPSPDSADPTGTRYVYQSWSDAGARVHTIVPIAPATYTATYGTEYYLTVTSTYATPNGATWYAAGTTAFAGLDLGTVAGTTGTQYVFVQWTGDASGAIFSQSSGILMNAPKTATAQWKTQYFLTVFTTYGVESGEGWYDAGSPATAGVTPTTVAGPAETRYVFVQWTGGATGTGGTSDPITMDAPKTATAQWKTQFHLTLPLPPPAGVTPSCSVAICWYDSGSIATVSVNVGGVESVPGQTRLGFIRWMGDATGTVFSQSNPITMDMPRAVTWEWQTQHKLTLTDSRGGVTQSSSDGWYTENTLASLTAADPWPDATDPLNVRYRFVSWSEDAAGILRTTTVTMNAPKRVTASWTTQFRVTVTTNPPGVGQATLDGSAVSAAGEWFDEGTPVLLSIATELQSSGKTYKFVSWDDATGGASTLVVVASPLTIVGNFREAGLLENVAVLGGIIAAIVAAILIALFLLWRRKKEPEEAPAPVAGAPPAPTGMMPPPPPAAPMESPAGTMECPSCGLTIEAKTGPCPICGAEVVAPAVPAKDERIGRLEEAYKSGRISKEQYQANLRKIRGNT